MVSLSRQERKRGQIGKSRPERKRQKERTLHRKSHVRRSLRAALVRLGLGVIERMLELEQATMVVAASWKVRQLDSSSLTLQEGTEIGCGFVRSLRREYREYDATALSKTALIHVLRALAIVYTDPGRGEGIGRLPRKKRFVRLCLRAVFVANEQTLMTHHSKLVQKYNCKEARGRRQANVAPDHFLTLREDATPLA